MPVLRNVLETLVQSSITLETFDRHGDSSQQVSGEELITLEYEGGMRKIKSRVKVLQSK